MRRISQILLVDTHCHLENEEFIPDLDQVVIRAQQESVVMISSAIHKEFWSKGCDIAMKYPNVYCSLGLDPVHFDDYELAIEFIREKIDELIAIGETGLDHFIVRDHDEREKQERAFRGMISLSKEFKIPIQIHSRSAGKKALDVLESAGADNVHMHAFDGKASLARVASRDLGYYFSIPTSVVRSPQKQKLVKAVALERLLLETDSPVLGAEKGVRNEPVNVKFALKEVATILRREEEEVRELILENSLRLYSKIGTY